jgi:hypothetical protein
MLRWTTLPTLLVLGLAPALAAAEEPCAPVKPCEIPDDDAPPPPSEAPADLAAEARALFDLVSCRGAPPAGLDAAAVRAYCGRLAPRLERAQRSTSALAAAVGPLRPARLPSAAVSPLSDAGLLRALAAYPAARNVTTTSTRGAGDPRLLPRLEDPARLRAFLSAAEADAEELSRGTAAGRTIGRGGEEAGALPALLLAAAAAGLEPAGLRFFRVEPAGTLHYLGPRELAAEEQARGTAPFASCELELVRAGQPGTRVTVRHLAADLSDRGAGADPGPLAHLALKGPLAAVLQGAGALAGEGYGRLRALLLARVACLVTDGSGPSAAELRKAGLVVEQRPLPGAGKDAVVAVARRPG